ncbi:ATP synthase subunit delta [Bacteroidia bacterium]|nr:ATP synthase subunit delta [Bacteroidia bacterium]GHT80066.1 ATP synthase subunit delta [Bacteroidia bacterium]
MNDGLISKRYAKALLEFATAHSEEGALYNRLKTLLANVVAVPQLRVKFQNQMVSHEDKLKLLYSAMGEGKVEESGKKFADILLQNQREQLMQNIAECYCTLYRHRHNISIVEITSAEPLSNQVIDHIRTDIEKQTHGTTEIVAHIDPRIGGGLIYQIDDLRLDGSVQGQLAKVSKQLAKK